jgi:hypothetical protein
MAGAWRSLLPLVTMVGCLVGCGAGGESSSGQPSGENREDAWRNYPLVSLPQPDQSRMTITTPGGAVVRPPAKPKRTVARPSKACERHRSRYRRAERLLFPPRPGLRARRLSPRTIEVSWWFRELSDDCRPAEMSFAFASSRSALAPFVTELTVKALSGRRRFRIPSPFDAPDILSASTETAGGGLDSISSRIAID